MSRTTKILGLSLLVVVALALSFTAGFNRGSEAQSGIAPELEVVQEAWDIILRDYVDKDRLDGSELSQGAIRGMLKALDDPYSSYLDSETYQLGLGSLEGKFEGIGAHVAVRDEQLMIIAPIAGSPADIAGIRAGDIILEVNGQPTADMSLAEAVLKIRGPQGTAVSLLVLHDGAAEPELIEIVRAEIEVASVHFEMIEGMAYINITQFSERTGEELAPVIDEIARGEATAIILDLRSNGGGLLQTVVDVTSHFLKEGVIVYVVDQGERTARNVKPTARTTELPMVILVDGYTASGGEVLAGALQDHGRAVIAGTRTFGKGSVNVLHQLKDGSGIYITTARWLTPDGHLIEGEGLQPDHKLELDEVDAIQWAVDYLKENHS